LRILVVFSAAEKAAEENQKSNCKMQKCGGPLRGRRLIDAVAAGRFRVCKQVAHPTLLRPFIDHCCFY